MRTSMRLFILLPNAFSIENRRQPLASVFAIYDLVRVHRSLRVSPAMAPEGYRCPLLLRLFNRKRQTPSLPATGGPLDARSVRQQNGGPGSGQKRQENKAGGSV